MYSLLEQSTGGVYIQIPISFGQITRGEFLVHVYSLKQQLLARYAFRLPTNCVCWVVSAAVTSGRFGRR